MRFAVSLAFLLTACTTFSHQPSRLTPGTAIHYVKSNLDGSKPSLVTMYIASPDEIDVSKSEKDLTDSADVRAHIDWSRFTADHLDAGVLLPSGEREKRAELRLRGNTLDVQIGDATETLRIDGDAPVHIYNFDLMSLNLTLPHLRAKTFKVAFIEPTFGQKPGVMEQRGLATFTYDGEEVLDGIATRRYRVTGPGLANRTGTLWINANDGYMQRWESELANNPGWNSLRLERRGVTSMTPAQWRDYKVKNIGVGVL